MIVCKDFQIRRGSPTENEDLVWDISEREMGFEYDEDDMFHPGFPGYYGHS